MDLGAIKSTIQTAIPVNSQLSELRPMGASRESGPIESPRRERFAVKGAAKGEEDVAKDTGKKVESLFASILVKELRKALPDQGFFGSGPGADVFNGWMDEFLGEQLARDGALNLAGRVETALNERKANEQ